MKTNHLSRREFLGRSAAVLGGVLLGGSSQAAVKRMHADQVPLGTTGLKCSRLGMGTGSDSGNIQKALGRDGFDRLVRYAYDQGITYFDCAQSYATLEWMGGAVKGLPREKLFLQSKISGQPEKVLEAIDRHRKIFDTDYLDSLLIHCMVQGDWTDSMKRIMDGFEEAREKQWIRAQGVSCHSLPALKRSAESDWTQLHLVRLNPQGAWVDTPEPTWNAKSGPDHVPPVVEQIRALRAKGRGILGMKLIGNGEFTQAEDREKAIRYVMRSDLCDAVVIGFKSAAEIDEAIERVNRALADA